MRIIFLNSWFAKTGKLFFSFIKENSLNTDIFCLTEVSPDLFSKMVETLNEFNGSYRKGLFLNVVKEIYGQVVFVRKNIQPELNCQILAIHESNEDVGMLQYTELEIGKSKICLGNVHGVALPGQKYDTVARVEQSKAIINFFNDKKGLKIIGGDFNLMPDTKSIKMFESAGYRNLIKEFDIKETRNRLTWEQFATSPDFIRQHFADYCFVSPEVEVINFEVPYNEISDHLPLILDFEI